MFAHHNAFSFLFLSPLNPVPFPPYLSLPVPHSARTATLTNLPPLTALTPHTALWLHRLRPYLKTPEVPTITSDPPMTL